jgi:hypothetical protein
VKRAAALALALVATAPVHVAWAKPEPARHVVVMVWDGMRPDFGDR